MVRRKLELSPLDEPIRLHRGLRVLGTAVKDEESALELCFLIIAVKDDVELGLLSHGGR